MQQTSVAEEARAPKTGGERIRSLMARHAALESILEEESRRPLPDTGLILTLKRQKLAIKDQIARLSMH